MWDACVLFMRKKRKIAPAIPVAGLVVAAMVSCFEPLLGAIDYQKSFSIRDTRVLAKEWISEKFPKGAIVAMAPLGLELKPPHAELPIPYSTIQFERYAPFYDTRWYEDVDLVVGSSFDYDRFLLDTARYAKFLQFYDSLKSGWHLQFEISPEHNQPGPHIWIYSPPFPAKKMFDRSLLDRLNLISSRELLRIFSRNVAGATYAKGAIQKSSQILEKTALLDSSFAHAERSAAFFDEQKFDQALSEIESGLRYSPDNMLLAGVHAQVLLALNRLDEAELEFQRSIALGEQSEPIYIGLAMTYAQRNEKEKAIELLTTYAQRLPTASDRRSYIQQQIDDLKSLK
jgi:tetratricopeptide (TPR) repeat protein